MKVYVGVFNKLPDIKQKGYYNIQLGADLNKCITDIRDNTGDNISKKNPNYCELTSLYWMCKNTKDKIVGLVHYRRFFYNSFFSLKNKPISEENVNKIMEKYDIILPKKDYILDGNIYEQYKNTHDIEDLDKCGEIIKEKYPDYVDTFNKVMNQKGFYPCNMYIGKKELIDNYCKWLFDIFFTLEPSIDLDKKDKYNKRVYGFLSERLFNVWIEKNDLKIKEKFIFNTESSFFIQRIKYIVKKLVRIVK